MNEKEIINILKESLDSLIQAESINNDLREEKEDEVFKNLSKLPNDGIIENLKKAVGKSKKRKAKELFILTAFMEDDEVVKETSRTFNSYSIEEQDIFLQSIALQKQNRFENILRKIIEENYPLEILNKAIMAVGKTNCFSLNCSLLKLAKDCELSSLRNIIISVSELGQKESYEFLSSVIKDSLYPNFLKVYAAWGINKINNKEGFEFLVKVLEEKGQDSLKAAQLICDLKGFNFNWNLKAIDKTINMLSSV